MNPRHLAPKASALPTALHPDDYSDVVAVVVKHVVGGGFLMGFGFFVMDGNTDVSTVPGVSIFVRGGKPYELPKRGATAVLSCLVVGRGGDASMNCRGKTKTVSIVAQDGGSVKQKNRFFMDKCGI